VDECIAALSGAVETKRAVVARTELTCEVDNCLES